MFANLLQDLRYGVRVLGRNPGFAAIAILTLAIGIGANTAIFTVVNAILLRPLPYPGSERLVRIWESNPQRGMPRFSASPVSVRDWVEQNSGFESIAAYDSDQVTLTGGAEPLLLSGYRVSQSFLPTLGVQPILGRNFLPEEDRAQSQQVVIISNRLWRSRFGSNPNILGQPIMLDHKPRTVVGVMPDTMKFPQANGDFWFPNAFDQRELSNRGAKWLGVIGRLKNGVILAQAETEMQLIAARIEKLDPAKATGWTVVLVPLHEAVVGSVRQTLLTVMAAVGMVLLIACANVANLLLARGTARRSELAIRTALGAGRGRLVAQMLTESMLLSVFGGIAGLALAFWISRALLTLAKNALPRLTEVQLDGQTLLFTLAVSILTGLIFGLLPALRSTSGSTEQALRDSAANLQGGKQKHRALRGLVVSEIALTLVLLVGAGLLIRTVGSLLHVDPGFDPKNTLTFRVSLPDARYQTAEQYRQFFEATLERMRALPGVQTATLANFLPIAGNGWFTYGVEVVGRPSKDGEELSAYYRVVDLEFFSALKMKLQRGRLLTDADREGQPLVAVVNESFTRKFFPGEDALGKEIDIGDRTTVPRTIIGIVADTKEESLNEAAPPVTYISAAQTPQSSMTVVLRAAGDPKPLLAAARNVIRGNDADLPLTEVATLEEVVEASVGESRFAAIVLGFFAAVALFLAMIGIYGVMSYAATQRTREMGIRMALGAQRRDVQALFLRDSSRLMLTGVVIGLALSLAAVRLVASMLFGVRPLDAFSFTVAALVLAGVAMLASYLPARRASRLDPMIALRYE